MATPKPDELYPIQDEPTDRSMPGMQTAMPPLPTAPGIRETPKFPAYQPDGTSNTSGPAFPGASETAQQRAARLYADRPAATDESGMSEMERYRRGLTNYGGPTGSAKALDNAMGQLGELPGRLGQVPGQIREGMAPLTGAIGSGIAGAARFLTEEKNPIIAQSNRRIAELEASYARGDRERAAAAAAAAEADRLAAIEEANRQPTRLEQIQSLRRGQAQNPTERIANEQVPSAQFGESAFDGGTSTEPLPVRRDTDVVERELLERDARLQEQARRQRDYARGVVDEPQQITQKDQPQTEVAQEEPSTSVSTTEFGTSYYEIQAPNSDQSVPLPATRNPHDNSFVPMDSQEITPNMIGEAAVANPEYRSGIQNIANIAIEAGMNNPVFQELLDAESSLDIQRSDFPAGRGGDSQFKDAQSQARRSYGRLAKRVMRQAPSVFDAQGRKKVTGERERERELESDIDNVLRMADKIMSDSAKDPYSEPMTQDRAVQMAMQRLNEGKQMRSRVQGMLQPGEGGVPAQQQLQPQQQPQQQAMPSGLIDSSQVPELIQQMEQFDLGYGLSYTNDGMGVITSGNNSFIATSVPNYPVPVAFARSAQEEQLALSLGIPVVSRNNPEVRGGRGLRAARPDAGSRQTRRSGPGRDMYMDDFDPEEQFSKSLEQAEDNFDTAYKTYTTYKSTVDQSGGQRDAYHQLARQFRESMGMPVEPGVDYVIRNNLNNDSTQDDNIEQQFAMWLESGVANPELAERANIKNGQLPQMREEPDDPLTQRFIQAYEEVKRQMQRLSGPSRPGQPEVEPTRENVRQLFLRNEARYLFREDVDRRNQMTQIRDREFGRDIQREQSRAYGETVNTGRGLVKTLARTPNPNFIAQPVTTDAEGNVYIEQPEEIVNTALIGDVIYEGVPMSIDKAALESATEELMLRRYQGDERSKVYADALLEVGQIIRDSFPARTFPANTQGNRRLMAISKQMLRRLGYVTSQEMSELYEG